LMSHAAARSHMDAKECAAAALVRERSLTSEI
jgi:hypothetical protein